MKNTVVRILGFVGLVALLSPSSLLATPATVALRLMNGASTVTVLDGGPGDANATAGAVTYGGSVGNWIMNVATGEGAPFLSLGDMDLNSLDTTASGNPGTLTIMFSEDNINSVVPAFDMSIGGTVNNINITYSAYYSSNNSFFSLTNLVGALGPFQSIGSTAAFSGDLTGQPASGTINSLTQVLTITPVGSLSSRSIHTFSGDSTLDPSNPIPTPEPSALLLLGSALLGTGGIIRKRGQRA